MVARKFFSLYIVLYLFLYSGYLLYIYLIRPTYNIVSLSAILLPFIFLLLFQLFLYKRTKIKGKKKAKIQFKTLSLLCSILPLWCGIMLGFNEYKSNFSTERWLNKPEERVYMVDDLLEHYKLNGMTSEEVDKLLGNPTQTEYFKEENNIVYYLGDERGLISIDSEWLILFFNDKNEVIKYSLKTD